MVNHFHVFIIVCNTGSALAIRTSPSRAWSAFRGSAVFLVAKSNEMLSIHLVLHLMVPKQQNKE